MSTEVAPSIEDAEELKGQAERKLKTWDDIARHKQQTMREQIIAAYEAYLRGERLSREELLILVKQFLYRKIRRLEYEYRNERETAQRADDWTQDALKAIFIALPRLPETVPTGEKFYSYVNKVAFNRRAKAGRYLNEQKKNVALFVERADEDGETYEDEHPDIHNRRTTINESGFVLPRSIMGVDAAICYLILDGKNYAEIAQELNTTEDNVKKKLQRLRAKIGPEREAKKAEQRERNRERHRPFKIDHPKRAAQPTVDPETAVTV